MNLTIWGVLCMCDHPDTGHGDYSESIYGEYHSEQEAEAGLRKGQEAAEQLRRNDPACSDHFSFKVLTPQELYDWQTAG